MSTMLVTGGAGFIGSHLCERLLGQGHRVVNLDNFNDFYDPEIKWNNIRECLTNPNYKLVIGDIRDKSVLSEIFEDNIIDIVFHLAAIAGVRKSLISPLEYVDVDINGTVNLLDYSRKNNVKKFVFSSSSSVYGTNPSPFREDDCITSQVSPYAASKAAGEMFCRTYNLLYKMPTVCLRYFTVYGPRQRPEMAIHDFVRKIYHDEEIMIFGDGSSSRDYTYIDDIVDGIMASASLECDFEIFNLGNSSPVYLDDLISIIEEKTGKTAKRKYIPMQKGDVEYTYADISKARELLSYYPKVEIADGIERFIKWYNNSVN